DGGGGEQRVLDAGQVGNRGGDRRAEYLTEQTNRDQGAADPPRLAARYQVDEQRPEGGDQRERDDLGRDDHEAVGRRVVGEQDEPEEERRDRAGQQQPAGRIPAAAALERGSRL